MAQRRNGKNGTHKRGSYEEAAQELAAAQAASNALPTVPTPSDEELIVQHHARMLAQMREDIAEQFRKDRQILDKRLEKAEKNMARFSGRAVAVPA